ncbi:MAG: hypothetical protein MJ064_04570 [Lachnospiraceae bacterium]|nr:hypothetical protein [Lachnospiraceae bacterium]
MKKKRIIMIVFIVVLILLVSCVISYFIPISSFRRNVNQYKKYVVLEDEHTLTRVRQRLEMSPEEYRKLKQQLISEGWQCDSIKQTGSLAIPQYYRESHTLSTDVLTEQYSCDMLGHDYSIKALLSSNSASETLEVVILEDVVLVEYRATLHLPFFPIGGKVH